MTVYQYLGKTFILKPGAAQTFLALSVAWSFKTGATIFVKREQVEPIRASWAKVALGLRALLFSATRIGAITAFFGPFLKPILGKDTVNIMYQELEITNYTLVTLQQAFFIFLSLLALHDLAIFALEIATSIPFRKARWQTKLLHLLESINVPDTFMDWDNDEEGEVEIKKTAEEYRTRWKLVLTETMGKIGLQMLSNLLMLVPIFVTSEF